MAAGELQAAMEDEKKGKKEERQQMIAETRRRSQAICRYMDLIPAPYYLGWTASPLDPGKVQPTSQMLMEAVRAASSTEAQTRKKEKKRKRADESEEARDASPKVDKAQSSTRAELHRKLQARIAELKEERRRKQSEADKAKAAEVRARREAERQAKLKGIALPSARVATPVEVSGSSSAGRNQRQASNINGSGPSSASQAPQPSQPKAEMPLQSSHANVSQSPKLRPKDKLAEQSVETSRLNFEPKESELPYMQGRRGMKGKHIKDAVRKAEEDERKIAEAEEDDREKVAQDIGMKKALARARGEKVHDDLTKLRKSQKSIDMKKKRSKEKWQERMDEQERQMKERQQKRKDNLKERASKKKARKQAKQPEWIEDEA